jgi:hypothetical protein
MATATGGLFVKKWHCKVLLIIALAWAIPQGARAASPDTVKSKFHFELSFGNSLLFISNSSVINIRSQKNIVVPTSSLLFFSELFSDRKLRLPVFFNLPTESKQFLVNGLPVYEKASPALGCGMVMRLFQLQIDPKSKIEAEAGPLLSVVIDGSNSLLVPLVAGRIRVMRGGNFIMYIGGSYTFGVNTLGMLYGTGSVF